MAKDILDFWKPPIQPLTDDEVDTISAFAGVTPEKVRCIAWLTTMAIRENARIDGRITMPVCEHGQGPCARCGVQ